VHRSPLTLLRAQLAGIFMLTWATQTYGFLTECAAALTRPVPPCARERVAPR